MKTALLLSGGMDSIALAWWLRPQLAITIDYGQLPARAEMQAAAQVCKELSIPHQVLTFDTSELGSGDLAGTAADAHAPASDWWPFRNQLLITLAGAAALRAQCDNLVIGTVGTDSTHRDGTPEFVAQMSKLMEVQEGGLSVQAPALCLTTAELIVQSGLPTELLAWSHSCHKANFPCSDCRGCMKHWEVLEALKMTPHELS